MVISTRGRYALCMMIDIAENYDKGYVSIKDVSERKGISRKYLEQIVPLLARAGMLVAFRGYKGGYKLTRAPEQITVGEIMRASEGALSVVPCLEFEGSENTEGKAIFVYEELKRRINDYLDSVTLKDILDK